MNPLKIGVEGATGWTRLELSQVDRALLAIREVVNFVGLHRGLDSIMKF
ncbi:MAG TPA: hypothetical protein VFY26_05915 [Anaerolineales bacterium]|nr:hypothetical protein [Anaerolineales bacterium]